MTLPLELGGIHDPTVRRALEQVAQQFPVVATGGGGGGAPSGPAGGVLGGTYPNPSFAADMATQAELDTHTGLTTTAHGGIVASTDPRLTDARAPTAHKASHEPGGTDALTGLTNASIAAGAGIVKTKLAALNIVNADVDAAAAIAKTKLANLDVVNADVNAAAAIAESKLNLATDAAAGTGSRRTLGTSATSAAAGNRGLPVGGTSGQVLSKNSATDYDTSWATPAGGSGAPSIVTTLPASPTDGQFVSLLVDSGGTLGGPYLWLCQYRTTSAKWHVLGGPALTSEITTNLGTTTSATYADVSLSLTIPFAGDYDIEIYSQHSDHFGTAGFGLFSYKIGAAAAVDTDGVRVYTSAETAFPTSMRRRKTGIAASTVLQAQHKIVTAGTFAANGNGTNPAGIRVHPVRLT